MNSSNYSDDFLSCAFNGLWFLLALLFFFLFFSLSGLLLVVLVLCIGKTAAHSRTFENLFSKLLLHERLCHNFYHETYWNKPRAYRGSFRCHESSKQALLEAFPFSSQVLIILSVVDVNVIICFRNAHKLCKLCSLLHLQSASKDAWIMQSTYELLLLDLVFIICLLIDILCAIMCLTIYNTKWNCSSSLTSRLLFG